MADVEYAQVIVTSEEIQKLKERTGKNTKKDAVREAILHYLECDKVESGDE